MADNGLTSALAKVKELIESKRAEELRLFLAHCDCRIKGPAFEFAIKELYRRNGWLTQQVGGSNDKGADVLLFAPNSPSKVSFIVQAKNHQIPLGIDAVRSEFVKFEQDGSDEYDCQNFKLVSLSGFTNSAIKKMAGFNIDLCGWDYVEKLIRNADAPWAKLSPTIELTSRNRETYKRIHDAWRKSPRVAAVQATGTGKSYLIAKAIVESQNGNILIMAPRTNTIRRQKKKTPWINNIDSCTYHALSVNEDRFQGRKFALIILDEFHRIGAPEWQQSVENLLRDNPTAKVLGTSATNIRYLDKCRDMAEELFGGNVVYGPNLPEAIATRLLPNPTYVTTYYSLKSELSRAEEIIEDKSQGPVQKRLLKNQLRNIHATWESKNQIAEIIARHADKNAKKYIVFCESIDHLNSMECQVSMWLKQAYSGPDNPYVRIHSHVVHSSRTEAENEEEIRNFEQAQPGANEIELLFTVNMLNESIHIKDVDGVFLLRKTISPVLYLQQIGRTLASDGCQTPTIFDLVDNSGGIKHADFKVDLETASKSFNSRRKAAGLPPLPLVEADVYDYVSETSQMIDDMLHVFDPWESRFQQLEEFNRIHGHCNIPQRSSSLGKWINHQRTLYTKGLLSEEKVQRLSSLGFSWDATSDFGDLMVERLRSVFEETGACPFKTGDPDADRWMESIRRMHRGQRLSQSRFQQLESIGFVWSLNDHQWNEKYSLLKRFVNENGHANVPKSCPDLGRWVRAQRDKYESLSEERIMKLNELGFRWRKKTP